MGGEVGGGLVGLGGISWLHAPCAWACAGSEEVGSSDEPRARAGLGRPWLSRPGEGEGEGEGEGVG